MPLINRKQKDAVDDVAQKGISQSTSTSNDERRQHGRIVRPTALSVTARHPGFFGKLHQPDGIKVLDFSRFGLAFESDNKYKAGEELTFEISEHSNQVEGVVGFVTHAEAHEKKYRCGIQFDFSANPHMRSKQLEQGLTEIELNLLNLA